MTTKIILSIPIIFFIVSLSRSSSVLIKPDSNTGCYINVSYREPYEVSYRELDCKYWCLSQKTYTKTRNEYRTAWKRECCSGYKEVNGICEPQCSSRCKNGFCDQPNTCACNYGWGGNVCDEPLLCFVTHLEHSNCSKEISEFPFRNHIEDTTKNPLIEWKGISECLPECLDRVDIITVKTNRWGNRLYHFLPNDSPCNHSIFWKKCIYVIGSVIGIIIFFVTVVYVVHIVRKKLTTKNNKMKNDPIDLEYDYVNPEQFQPCCESNHFMVTAGFAPFVQRS